jgi:mannitol/fructose-specific phosphotransferase system IIA component (Ntr-type)
MPSLLNELLDPKQVALELRATNQAEAILEIVELLRANGKVEEYYQFSDAVMEREGRSSTNTGDGVAFPHARTDLVKKMVLGIGRSKKGVRFGETKKLVHLIFLVGVSKRMVNDYLVCVGTLARLMSDKAIRTKVLEAGTTQELIEQLRSASLLLE